MSTLTRLEGEPTSCSILGYLLISKALKSQIFRYKILDYESWFGYLIENLIKFMINKRI